MGDGLEELERKVTLVVAQVILEATGRCPALQPDELLFERGYLNEPDLGRLLMALQSEFDFAFDAAELNTRVLSSIAAIATLVATRRRDQPNG